MGCSHLLGGLTSPRTELLQAERPPSGYAGPHLPPKAVKAGRRPCALRTEGPLPFWGGASPRCVGAWGCLPGGSSHECVTRVTVRWPGPRVCRPPQQNLPAAARFHSRASQRTSSLVVPMRAHQCPRPRLRPLGAGAPSLAAPPRLTQRGAHPSPWTAHLQAGARTLCLRSPILRGSTIANSHESCRQPRCGQPSLTPARRRLPRSCGSLPSPRAPPPREALLDTRPHFPRLALGERPLNPTDYSLWPARSTSTVFTLDACCLRVGWGGFSSKILTLSPWEGTGTQLNLLFS